MSSFVEHVVLLGAAQRKTAAAISRYLKWPEVEIDSLYSILTADPGKHPVLRARTVVDKVGRLRGYLPPEQAGFVFIAVVGLSAAEGVTASA